MIIDVCAMAKAIRPRFQLIIVTCFLYTLCWVAYMYYSTAQLNVSGTEANDSGASTEQLGLPDNRSINTLSSSFKLQSTANVETRTNVGNYKEANVTFTKYTIIDKSDKVSDGATMKSHKHIAIVGGITSKGMLSTNRRAWLTGSAFFTSLLPSFCLTCSPRFHYHFYWAFDSVDTYFSDTNNIDQFTDMFYTTVDKHCSSDVRVSVKLVRCSHRGKPAWAQNDAVMEAYVDSMDYFYR